MNMSANYGSFGARAISGTHLGVVCKPVRPLVIPMMGGWQIGGSSKRRKHR